jgi:uncharacterized protein YneF (UPF0154 family)
MAIIILLIVIVFLITFYIRNKQIEKQLRIKSAEVEVIRAVGGEYGEKYEERSNNCEIIKDKNVSFDN